MAKRRIAKANPEEPKEEVVKKTSSIVNKVTNTAPPKRSALSNNPTTVTREDRNPIAMADRIGPSKTKKMGDDKYDRISDSAGVEKFKEMSQKIQDGTHQWAYYGIDGDSGYHYYLRITKK